MTETRTFPFADQIHKMKLWMASPVVLPVTVSRGQLTYLWRSFQELQTCFDVINKSKQYVQIEKEFRTFTTANKIRVVASYKTPIGGQHFTMRQLMSEKENGANWYVYLCDAPQVHPMYGEYVAWSTHVLGKY